MPLLDRYRAVASGAASDLQDGLRRSPRTSRCAPTRAARRTTSPARGRPRRQSAAVEPPRTDRSRRCARSRARSAAVATAAPPPPPPPRRSQPSARARLPDLHGGLRSAPRTRVGLIARARPARPGRPLRARPRRPAWDALPPAQPVRSRALGACSARSPSAGRARCADRHEIALRSAAWNRTGSTMSRPGSWRSPPLRAPPRRQPRRLGHAAIAVVAALALTGSLAAGASALTSTAQAPTRAVESRRTVDEAGHGWRQARRQVPQGRGPPPRRRPSALAPPSTGFVVERVKVSVLA